MKFRISSLKNSFGKNNQVFAEDCESLLHYVDATIENVRRISQDLSPTIVTEFGLSFALEYLLEGFREHYDPQCCSMEMDEINEYLTQQVKVGINLIFQDILTNAFKHGKATSLTAVIRKEQEGMTLSRYRRLAVKLPKRTTAQ